MGAQIIHELRRKEANGCIDIPGRQLKVSKAHMMSAGLV